MTTIQTPEILQVMNNAIANIVYFVEYYGIVVFYLLCMLFVVWIVWNIGTYVYALLKKNSR